MNKTLNKEQSSFIMEVCDEHFMLTRNKDTSLNYLWHMYTTNGGYRGHYKPFIIFAELCLNKTFGIVTDEDIEGMRKLLSSSDSENVYLAIEAIKFYRDKRIKEYGTYVNNKLPEKWENIRDTYSTDVLSVDGLNKYLKPQV